MNLTPEQMDAAVEAVADVLRESFTRLGQWLTIEQRSPYHGDDSERPVAHVAVLYSDLIGLLDGPSHPGDEEGNAASGVFEHWLPRSALSAALPVLFAAWQEQMAAKAGGNPHDPHVSEADRQRHIGYREGAAAGAAASEERIRRAEETRENANQASVRVELENQRLRERLDASETRVRELEAALANLRKHIGCECGGLGWVPDKPYKGPSRWWMRCYACGNPEDRPEPDDDPAALAALLSEEPG